MSSSSSITAAPSPAPNEQSVTSKKQSKIIVLKLSATVLGRFVPKSVSQKNNHKENSSPSTVSTPTDAPAEASATAPTSSPPGDASETHATPPAPEVNDASKQKVSGAKAGTKRAFGQINDGGPKPRPKAAPKKRRLDDIRNESGKTGAGGLTNGSHKMGPKANQGAINAGLRALDRSGKPCRKWERRPFQLKSFTGIVWELPSWRTPNKQPVAEENSDEKEASQQSASKANDSSVAMGSEKSNNAENGTEPILESTPAASSPAPASVPVSIAVAATG